MAYLFCRKNKGIQYIYEANNKKINGVSKRINERSICRVDKMEKYIMERITKKSKTEIKEYGLTMVLLNIIKKLNIDSGFEELIKTKKDKKTLSKILILTIIYSICCKGGKHSLKNWYQKTNLSNIIEVPLKELETYNICRSMDLLEPHMDKIEKLICYNIIALDSEELEILFFDMTNQYLYVDDNQSKLLKYGNNKFKRYDLKQFSLALTASGKSGIPLFQKTYPGNINDITFFGDYIDELSKKIKETGVKIENRILVFDKGNNSPKNIKKVNKFKYTIIGALRPSEHKKLIKTNISELNKKIKINKKEIKYKEIILTKYDIKMKVILTFDNSNKRKKIHTFENYLSKIKQKIKEKEIFFNEKLNKNRKSKWEEDEEIIKNIKKIVSKQYSNLFMFEIKKKDRNISINVNIVADEYDNLQESFGKYLLFTNKVDFPTKRIIELYRAKDEVEKLFQYLKDFRLILLEPQFHRLDKRIKVNVFLKVIGIQLLAFLNKKLKECENAPKIYSAVEKLKNINKIFYYNMETGLKTELSAELDEEQKLLMKLFGI
ncbi:IS1634 family transposase [Candidatus Woesearchaeota archaeon]|nr:IS1634 family transposase [Candidatus Woesearchaeota archaeon]